MREGSKGAWTYLSHSAMISRLDFNAMSFMSRPESEGGELRELRK
jgi:hypothetical protein